LVETRTISLSAEELSAAKEKALDWATTQPGAFVFLDSCGYADAYGAWEWLLGVGSASAQFGAPGVWVFGCFDHDVGASELNQSYIHIADGRGYGRAHFIAADTVVGVRRGSAFLEVWADDAAAVWEEINAACALPALSPPSVRFIPLMDRARYIQTVEALREHIAAGDCYEINLCNARVAEGRVQADAPSLYRQLRAASPAPFSALVRMDGRYTVCASPERYLRVQEGRAISQPIKGTARRGATAAEDAALADALRTSPKERAENVMIVDLTRSDLARVCTPGSVHVDELFGVQTFPAVHQLVSTVSGALRAGCGPMDAVRASFPMGSMTGAPKEMVMRLIRRYEPAPRGPFSGAIGYSAPDGSADLNVVIRTLFFDKNTGSLWYSTGGAITWASDPEAEWEETLLKGIALERIFGM